MDSDKNLPKDTSSSFIQDFSDLQIPKISDYRICFKQNFMPPWGRRGYIPFSSFEDSEQIFPCISPPLLRT